MVSRCLYQHVPTNSPCLVQKWMASWWICDIAFVLKSSESRNWEETSAKRSRTGNGATSSCEAWFWSSQAWWPTRHRWSSLLSLWVENTSIPVMPTPSYRRHQKTLKSYTSQALPQDFPIAHPSIFGIPLFEPPLSSSVADPNSFPERLNRSDARGA